MSKKRVIAGAATVAAVVASVEGIELSLKERNAIRDTKAAVMGAVQAFKGFREKVRDYAPKIIGLFNTMKAAREAGKFALADFARLYDPTVPGNARTNKQQEDGYTNHPTYLALAYMQRAIAPKRATAQGTANTAAWRFERVIATLLTMAADPAEVWGIVAQEFGKDGAPMIERSIKALKNRVAKVEPLIDLSKMVAKPVHFKPAAVIRMNVAPGTDAAGTAAMRDKLDTLAAKGKRVRVSA